MPSKNPLPRSRDADSQEPVSFDATARRMLENALALNSAEGTFATPEIRKDVKCLVAHAKARGVQVERMIIELKDACNSSESTGQQKSDVVSKLVTICIREFYAGEPEPLGR